jgi:hypothetical protein
MCVWKVRKYFRKAMVLMVSLLAKTLVINVCESSMLGMPVDKQCKTIWLLLTVTNTFSWYFTEASSSSASSTSTSTSSSYTGDYAAEV